tara:strand:- start:228 stop:560 length:333 start_codon:yes stop_codon:yes gene_type:complete
MKSRTAIGLSVVILIAGMFILQSNIVPLTINQTTIELPKTKINGAGTVSAGDTETIITHNLGKAPTGVFISPKQDPAKRFWADTLTGTTFKLKIDSSHGSDIDFYWVVYE